MYCNGLQCRLYITVPIAIEGSPGGRGSRMVDHHSGRQITLYCDQDGDDDQEHGGNDDDDKKDDDENADYAHDDDDYSSHQWI